MVEAVETMDGWYTLHDLRTINWQKWKLAPKEERIEAITEFQELLTAWQAIEDQKDGSHGIYHIVGQKADLMFMVLRPTMHELAAVELALNKTKIAEYLTPTHSHVSVVELSKYRPDKDGIDPETLPETQARLKPILPKWEHVSFYPMDRKREGENNWYTLNKGERGKLLYEHSLTGRKYTGKVKQIITGSIGFDRWEWGVTLFAHDVLQLKKIVYEMRFDEATSRYGEFDDFFVGNRLDIEDLLELFEV
jgi:chlorite dismutase